MSGLMRRGQTSPRGAVGIRLWRRVLGWVRRWIPAPGFSSSLVLTLSPSEHVSVCVSSPSELRHSFPLTPTAAGSCILSFLEVFDFSHNIFHFYLLWSISSCHSRKHDTRIRQFSSFFLLGKVWNKITPTHLLSLRHRLIFSTVAF